MMQLIENPPREIWEAILARPILDADNLSAKVKGILQAVAEKGDDALFKFTSQFDGVRLEKLQVTQTEISEAHSKIEPELKESIQQAADNIDKFHRAQIPQDIQVETMPGVNCWQKSVAIEKVGLYIPGGTAPLFSTILMLGVPAKIAGCEEIILCSPPDKNGDLHPAILFTADLIGITKIFKVGGAQAIAAMAYGSASIPQVYKIFGPGNQYVTAAKQLVGQLGTSIDLPAGPSEVLIYADEGANPEFVAADLLSQAEHGPDSQVVLIIENKSLVAPIQKAIEKQLVELPRKEIAQKALASSLIIVSNNRQDSIDLINTYAPEHLILCCSDATPIAQKIKNAGSIFLGYYTPESAGDYASGTNHTLPTNGFARAFSGVNMDSFYKKITYQEISPAGLKTLGPVVEKMAEAEQLIAHKRAVSIRLQQMSSEDLEIKDIEIIKRKDILKLVRKNILNLQPYASARSEYSGKANIWLDANENPENLTFNRYPDPLQKELKEIICKIYPTVPEQLFLGNGSDEVIDLLIRIFCQPGIDKIITLPPTYGMYKVTAATNDVAVKEVPLQENFQLDIPAILKYNSSRDKILFICSPNNPTGNLIDTEDIEKVLHTFPGIVVIDQAYIDFSPESSWLNRLGAFPNLIILQTFSKAWGMAGVRLGMAFAQEAIIELMNKIKAPYNISSVAQEYVINQLSEKNILANKTGSIVRRRNQLKYDLEKINLIKKIYSSEANFLLCKMDQPQMVYDYLLKQGIVVRDRSSLKGCEDCLRITVGTETENKKLIQVLADITI